MQPPAPRRKATGTFQRFLLVISCMIVFGMIVGTPTLQGLLTAPICDEFGWTRSSFLLHTTISSVTMIFVQGFATALYKRFRAERLFAGVIIASAFAHIASTGADNLGAWYTLAIVRGVCLGFVVFVPMPLLVNAWFDRNVGLLLSMITLGSPLIAMLASPLVQLCADAWGWRTAQAAIGLTSLTALPFALVFIRSTPPDSMRKHAPEADHALDDDRPIDMRRMHGAFDVRPFWATPLLLVVVFAFSLLDCIAQQAPLIVGAMGHDSMRAAMCLSVLMAGSIVGKLTFGVLNDRIGALANASACLALVTIGLAFLLFSTNARWALFAGWAAIGMGSSLFPILPALLMRWFAGESEFSQANAKASTVASIASAGAPLFYSLGFELSGSYSPALTLLCIALPFCIIALHVLAPYRKRRSSR